MTIYQRIKDIAQERKISIREIENTLGFSNGTMSKWSDSANIKKLQQVADFFNIDVNFLLGKSNDSSAKHAVDLADDNTIAMYQGKPISDEDMKIIKRLLRGKE